MSSARTKAKRLGSIGLRLTAWYVGVFLASTLLLATVAGFSIRSSIRTRVDATVSSTLATHRQAFETDGMSGLKKSIESPDASRAPLYARVLDRANTTVFEYRSSTAGSFDAKDIAPRSSSPGLTHVRDRDHAAWRVGTTELKDGLRLELALSDGRTEEIIAHLRSGLVVVWIGAVVIGLLGGFYLTRRALRPIAKLTETAGNVIASGDLSLRVPVRAGHDELDRLTELFNGMLKRNETLVRGMREALDNVAHDLRTPLTRLRTGAEVALQGSAGPDALRDALADGIEESDRLLAMLTTIMDISEAETGIMKLDRAPIELSAVVRRALSLYEDVAAERGVRVITHLAPSVSVNGDAVRLERVVANLIDNAVKYTPSGGRVELTTSFADGWACLTVADTGMGISPEDLPRIWERLYRADQSRSEHGLGLGLSLVKAIVEAHGGEVAVTSKPGSTAFTVRLPSRP